MFNIFKNLIKIELDNLSKNLSHKNNAKNKKIFNILGIIFLIGIMGLWGYQISEKFLTSISSLGIVVNFFIKAIIIMAFVVSIVMVIAQIGHINFNESKTDKYLDTLPINSEIRFTSKILSKLIGSYSLMGMFFVVPIIYFGVVQHKEFAYYIYSAIAFLLLPILPNLIMIYMTFLFTTLVKFIFSKKIQKFIGFLISFTVMMIMCIFYAHMNSSGSEDLFILLSMFSIIYYN